MPRALRDAVTTLTTSDGVHLSALVLGDGTDGVVLSHEQGYGICSFLPLARRLADRGLQVILPEYRNHGASETSADNDHLDRDGAAALAELHRRGVTRVAVGGASCGGTVSALIGATEPELTALLMMSSPAHCGSLDGVAAVRSIAVPTLMIVSPGDMAGAVEREVRTLYRAAAAPDKELIIDDSGYHGTDMFLRCEHGQQLQRRVLDFIVAAFD